MTKITRALPFIASLVLASEAAAQQSPPPPSCAAEEFRRFDFWVGEWVVSNAKGDTIGTSLNFWEPATRRWNQLWVGGGGAILRLEGDYLDGAMELTGKTPRQTPNGPAMDRIRWTPAADGTVEQLWLIPPDAGTSWRESFRGIYRKKP